MCAQYLGAQSSQKPSSRRWTPQWREAVATTGYPLCIPAEMWRIQVLQGRVQGVCHMPSSEGAQHGHEDEDFPDAGTSQARRIHGP